MTTGLYKHPLDVLCLFLLQHAERTGCRAPVMYSIISISIHPFFHFLYPRIQFRVKGRLELIPAAVEEEAGNTLNGLPVHHSNTLIHIKQNFLYIYLDFYFNYERYSPIHFVWFFYNLIYDILIFCISGLKNTPKKAGILKLLPLCNPSQNT